MSTTTLRLPTVANNSNNQQQRPQRSPLPSTSTSAVRSFPTRDASLRRPGAGSNDSTSIDPHLEAALENRRRNGLPVGSRGAWINPSTTTTTVVRAGTGGFCQEKEEEILAEQFEDSQQAGEVETWEENERMKENSPAIQRESLIPLSQSAMVSRMTSTRRYMDQLDEDEALDEEDLGNENGNDRATWHSSWGSEARDSVASLSTRLKVLKANGAAGRESALSTRTFDTESANGFHYSMYETMHAPPDSNSSSDPAQAVPPASSHKPLLPASPSIPISPPSSASSPSTSAPVVRIGPPSPTTDSFLNDPQSSTVWNDLPSSPPASPVSRSRQPSSPISPASTTSNRAKSQTSSKNFSRPFVSIPSSPLPNSNLTTSTSSSQVSPSIASTIQRQRPVSPRADSLESMSSPNPLDRKSSLGATSSSMGHSGSSTGHSMSTSWEERKLQAWRQHEEAKRAINLAREKSQRNRIEQEYRNDGVEELTIVGDVDDAYGGEEGREDEESETSIHFPQLAQQQPQLPESPYLAYAAPSPPQPVEVKEGTFYSQSVFSEALPRSPPPQQLSHPAAAFSSEPRPAPAPPTAFQPSVSLPLPIPGSPPLQRRPSESPSLTSFYSSATPRLATGPINLSASAPPSSTVYSTSPPAKQRNVLRKSRPRKREEDEPNGLSAPMSRAGSALSSHSHRSAATSDGETSTKVGPWARFRSRSKSRSRGDKEASSSARKSTFFDDPLPPPSPFYPEPVPSITKPTLRHLTSSASLQPPRSQPLDSFSSPSSTIPTFPSPSSASPLSQAEFARLQASRPAFLRSKTSFGNANISMGAQSNQQSQEWVLKNVTGPKSVATGLVHAGEANSLYGGGDGEEMERLNESIAGVGFGLPRGAMNTTSMTMGRSVSDQGPRPQHERSSSSGQNSLYSSNYSVYSLPPSPLNTSPTTAINPVNLESPSPSDRIGGGGGRIRSVRNSTIEKAKETLGGGPAVRAKMMRTPSGNEKKVVDPITPEDFLQVGIDHHEAGDLERAAWCFEQSARKDGGCGAGMLMYGLTLRHGWGCQLNAPLGFRYLQMAAESVVEDLDRVVFGGRTLTESEANTKAAKSELVLALHEIGVSYRFGWGVEKNKQMAVSYFTLSADLGDQDAQQDVAFCYANGKGVKKDLKKAAHYYRLAIAQGAEDWGLSWIYKPKYMDT